MLLSNFNLVIDFKGYFHNIESPIWTFVIYLDHFSESVHAATNVCMKHIYKVLI